MLELKVFLDKKLFHKTVLSKERLTIGRSAENDIVLHNPHVSRLHVVIRKDENNFVLEDRSTNGILLDGEKISGSAVLSPKCRFEIYPFQIECLTLNELKDDGTLPISKKDVPIIPSQSFPETAYTGETINYHFGTLVGESPPMQKVYRLIEDVAASNATVLIRGEHGTGKELAALAIHEASQRREMPFIAVNCAAIPFDLIESELFGHEKGAFTGAHAAQKGKIEEAGGGTLFLDEIGELSLSAQAKLLRFLQGKVIIRLGSPRETHVDVRIVAATNKDLERAVKEEKFRADLYYRIKVVQIPLPCLKDHREDIPLLAGHFLHKLAGDLNLSSTPLLTDEAMSRLCRYRWPGNTRQLENVLYSAIIRSRPPYVLDKETIQADSPTWDSQFEEKEEIPPMDEINKQLLLRILKENQWDTTRAAEVLKVSRGTVYYKMKKYGIETPAMKTNPTE